MRLSVSSAREYDSPSVSVSAVAGSTYGWSRTAPVSGASSSPPQAVSRSAAGSSTAAQARRDLPATADPVGEVGGQGREGGQPCGGVIGVVEEGPHEGAADDDAVGEGG